KPVPAFQPKRPQRIQFESKFELPRLLLGYNTVDARHPDAYALEVLQGILAGGKASRLYAAMVEGAEVALSVSANSNVGRYPGLFSLQVDLLGNRPIGDMENLLITEIEKVRKDLVTPEELTRVKRGIVANAIFTRESCHELANSIANGILLHDLEYLRG